MRIGIFDPYLDDLGGGEKYMMTIAQDLSQDHEVEVFWDSKQDLEKLTERFSLNLTRVKIVKNIFSKDLTFLDKLRESLKYDAIILLSDGSLPILLCKKTFIHFQQPFPHIKPTLINKLKTKKINKFFCNSKFTKSFIDKEFNINSLVLYPPVKIQSENKIKENIILNVGRFRVKDITTNVDGNAKGIGDFKKQSVIAKVFKEMVDGGLKNWKLVFAVSVKKQEEEIFEEFKKSIDGYPVEFLINKPNKDLWETYSKAKIYWHASGFGEDLENHPEFAEHFGISTVEAMGAGCVPVVINAGGQKEIVESGENGFLWDSLEELKLLTLALVKDNELLIKTSLKAKESANRFSNEKFKKELKDIVL